MKLLLTELDSRITIEVKGRLKTPAHERCIFGIISKGPHLLIGGGTGG